MNMYCLLGLFQTVKTLIQSWSMLVMGCIFVTKSVCGLNYLLKAL